MTAALNPGRPSPVVTRFELLNRTELVRAVESLSDAEAHQKRVPRSPLRSLCSSIAQRPYGSGSNGHWPARVLTNATVPPKTGTSASVLPLTKPSAP